MSYLTSHKVFPHLFFSVVITSGVIHRQTVSIRSSNLLFLTVFNIFQTFKWDELQTIHLNGVKAPTTFVSVLKTQSLFLKIKNVLIVIGLIVKKRMTKRLGVRGTPHMVHYGYVCDQHTILVRLEYFGLRKYRRSFVRMENKTSLVPTTIVLKSMTRYLFVFCF